MDANGFEPNSQKYRMEKAEKEAMGQNAPTTKRVEKVVTGKTSTRKRSLLKRFADIFLSEDVGDVKTYLVYDVLIPAIKENVADMINGAVGMLFFGEATRRVKKPVGGTTGSKFNYNAISTPATRERMPNYSRSRIAHNFDDVIFETRAEAELVLDGMVEILNSEYRQVTVADFYDLAGMTTSFTDNKYGWTDLRGARVVGSASRGYSIDLPRCMALE